ncbi:MAG TPA: glycosyltransferase family 39 protein [Chthoniobacterales bacterium]
MSRTSPLPSSRGHWIILAGFFLVALFAYIWANGFPFFYHSDEESKALQLLYGYRNFWHPMLMLSATKLIAHLTGADGDSQAITVVGRCLSATFSAVGVAAFVHLAWRRQGMGAAVLTGFFLLILPLLFDVSHYCKEDPALFMGFAFTLLAFDCFWERPDKRRVLLAGLAAGVATSAKYPGALLILAGIVVVLLRTKETSSRLQFLLAAFATVLAINWEWLFHMGELSLGVQRESAMLAAGHDGVASHLPHGRYWLILLWQLGWGMLVAALAGMFLSRMPGQLISKERVLGATALLLLVLMSFSPKVSERYLLPFMAAFCYLAACGVIHMVCFLPRFRTPATFLLVALVSAHPLMLLGEYVRDFSHDSRAEMSAWTKSHFKKHDRLATSLWTRLPGFYQGQYIVGVAPADYVADLGTVAQLKEMGYTWVAVADVESARFEDAQQTGTSTSESAFQHRRTFYEDLRSQADLRWSAPKGTVYNLHPGLKLYQLRP